MLPHPCPNCGRLVRGHNQCVCGVGGMTTTQRLGKNWTALSKFVVESEQVCRNCGTTETYANPLTTDHIVPRSRGGSNDRENLQCLCRRCNSAKGGAG